MRTLEWLVDHVKWAIDHPSHVHGGILVNFDIDIAKEIYEHLARLEDLEH